MPSRWEGQMLRQQSNGTTQILFAFEAFGVHHERKLRQKLELTGRIALETLDKLVERDAPADAVRKLKKHREALVGERYMQLIVLHSLSAVKPEYQETTRAKWCKLCRQIETLDQTLMLSLGQDKGYMFLVPTSWMRQFLGKDDIAVQEAELNAFLWPNIKPNLTRPEPTRSDESGVPSAEKSDVKAAGGSEINSAINSQRLPTVTRQPGAADQMTMVSHVQSKPAEQEVTPDEHHSVSDHEEGYRGDRDGAEDDDDSGIEVRRRPSDDRESGVSRQSSVDLAPDYGTDAPMVAHLIALTDRCNEPQWVSPETSPQQPQTHGVTSQEITFTSQQSGESLEHRLAILTERMSPPLPITEVSQQSTSVTSESRRIPGDVRLSGATAVPPAVTRIKLEQPTGHLETKARDGESVTLSPYESVTCGLFESYVSEACQSPAGSPETPTETAVYPSLTLQIVQTHTIKAEPPDTPPRILPLEVIEISDEDELELEDRPVTVREMKHEVVTEIVEDDAPPPPLPGVDSPRGRMPLAPFSSLRGRKSSGSTGQKSASSEEETEDTDNDSVSTVAAEESPHEQEEVNVTSPLKESPSWLQKLKKIGAAAMESRRSSNRSSVDSAASEASQRAKPAPAETIAEEQSGMAGEEYHSEGFSIVPDLEQMTDSSVSDAATEPTASVVTAASTEPILFVLKPQYSFAGSQTRTVAEADCHHSSRKKKRRRSVDGRDVKPKRGRPRKESVEHSGRDSSSAKRKKTEHSSKDRKNKKKKKVEKEKKDKTQDANSAGPSRTSVVASGDTTSRQPPASNVLFVSKSSTAVQSSLLKNTTATRHPPVTKSATAIQKHSTNVSAVPSTTVPSTVLFVSKASASVPSAATPRSSAAVSTSTAVTCKVSDAAVKSAKLSSVTAVSPSVNTAVRAVTSSVSPAISSKQSSAPKDSNAAHAPTGVTQKLLLVQPTPLSVHSRTSTTYSSITSSSLTAAGSSSVTATCSAITKTLSSVSENAKLDTVTSVRAPVVTQGGPGRDTTPGMATSGMATLGMATPGTCVNSSHTPDAPAPCFDMGISLGPGAAALPFRDLLAVHSYAARPHPPQMTHRHVAPGHSRSSVPPPGYPAAEPGTHSTPMTPQPSSAQLQPVAPTLIPSATKSPVTSVTPASTAHRATIAPTGHIVSIKPVTMDTVVTSSGSGSKTSSRQSAPVDKSKIPVRQDDKTQKRPTPSDSRRPTKETTHKLAKISKKSDLKAKTSQSSLTQSSTDSKSSSSRAHPPSCSRPTSKHPKSAASSSGGQTSGTKPAAKRPEPPKKLSISEYRNRKSEEGVTLSGGTVRDRLAGQMAPTRPADHRQAPGQPRRQPGAPSAPSSSSRPAADSGPRVYGRRPSRGENLLQEMQRSVPVPKPVSVTSSCSTAVTSSSGSGVASSSSRPAVTSSDSALPDIQLSPPPPPPPKGILKTNRDPRLQKLQLRSDQVSQRPLEVQPAEVDQTPEQPSPASVSSETCKEPTTTAREQRPQVSPGVAGDSAKRAAEHHSKQRRTSTEKRHHSSQRPHRAPHHQSRERSHCSPRERNRRPSKERDHARGLEQRQRHSHGQHQRQGRGKTEVAHVVEEVTKQLSEQLVAQLKQQLTHSFVESVSQSAVSQSPHVQSERPTCQQNTDVSSEQGRNQGTCASNLQEQSQSEASSSREVPAVPAVPYEEIHRLTRGFSHLLKPCDLMLSLSLSPSPNWCCRSIRSFENQRGHRRSRSHGSRHQNRNDTCSAQRGSSRVQRSDPSNQKPETSRQGDTADTLVRKFENLVNAIKTAKRPSPEKSGHHDNHDSHEFDLNEFMDITEHELQRGEKQEQLSGGTVRDGEVDCLQRAAADTGTSAAPDSRGPASKTRRPEVRSTLSGTPAATHSSRPANRHPQQIRPISATVVSDIPPAMSHRPAPRAQESTPTSTPVPTADTRSHGERHAQSRPATSAPVCTASRDRQAAALRTINTVPISADFIAEINEPDSPPVAVTSNRNTVSSPPSLRAPPRPPAPPLYNPLLMRNLSPPKEPPAKPQQTAEAATTGTTSLKLPSPSNSEVFDAYGTPSLPPVSIDKIKRNMNALSSGSGTGDANHTIGEAIEKLRAMGVIPNDVPTPAEPPPRRDVITVEVEEIDLGSLHSTEEGELSTDSGETHSQEASKETSPREAAGSGEIQGRRRRSEPLISPVLPPSPVRYTPPPSREDTAPPIGRSRAVAVEQPGVRGDRALSTYREIPLTDINRPQNPVSPLVVRVPPSTGDSDDEGYSQEREFYEGCPAPRQIVSVDSRRRLYIKPPPPSSNNSGSRDPSPWAASAKDKELDERIRRYWAQSERQTERSEAGSVASRDDSERRKRDSSVTSRQSDSSVTSSERRSKVTSRARRKPSPSPSRRSRSRDRDTRRSRDYRSRSHDRSRGRRRRSDDRSRDRRSRGEYRKSRDRSRSPECYGRPRSPARKSRKRPRRTSTSSSSSSCDRRRCRPRSRSRDSSSRSRSRDERLRNISKSDKAGSSAASQRPGVTSQAPLKGRSGGNNPGDSCDYSPSASSAVRRLNTVSSASMLRSLVQPPAAPPGDKVVVQVNMETEERNVHVADGDEDINIVIDDDEDGQQSVVSDEREAGVREAPQPVCETLMGKMSGLLEAILNQNLEKEVMDRKALKRSHKMAKSQLKEAKKDGTDEENEHAMVNLLEKLLGGAQRLADAEACEDAHTVLNSIEQMELKDKLKKLEDSMKERQLSIERLNKVKECTTNRTDWEQRLLSGARGPLSPSLEAAVTSLGLRVVRCEQCWKQDRLLLSAERCRVVDRLRELEGKWVGVDEAEPAKKNTKETEKEKHASRQLGPCMGVGGMLSFCGGSAVTSQEKPAIEITASEESKAPKTTPASPLAPVETVVSTPTVASSQSPLPESAPCSQSGADTADIGSQKLMAERRKQELLRKVHKFFRKKNKEDKDKKDQKLVQHVDIFAASPKKKSAFTSTFETEYCSDTDEVEITDVTSLRAHPESPELYADITPETDAERPKTQLSLVAYSPDKQPASGTAASSSSGDTLPASTTSASSAHPSTSSSAAHATVTTTTSVTSSLTVTSSTAGCVSVSSTVTQPSTSTVSEPDDSRITARNLLFAESSEPSAASKIGFSGWKNKKEKAKNTLPGNKLVVASAVTAADLVSSALLTTSAISSTVASSTLAKATSSVSPTSGTDKRVSRWDIQAADFLHGVGGVSGGGGGADLMQLAERMDQQISRNHYPQSAAVQPPATSFAHPGWTSHTPQPYYQQYPSSLHYPYRPQIFAHLHPATQHAAALHSAYQRQQTWQHQAAAAQQQTAASWVNPFQIPPGTAPEPPPPGVE